MLVLTIKEGDSIKLGENILITYVEERPFDNFKQIRIGVDAPKDIRILRNHLTEKERKEWDERSTKNRKKPNFK